MDNPARLVLVTGHVFGVRAFEGIFTSPAFLGGRIEVCLMIGLSATRAGATVGYRSIAAMAQEQGVPHVLTSDGSLLSLAGMIEEAQPDYILVIGWSRLVADYVLTIPDMHDAGEEIKAGGRGCIGMHPSYLPVGRGRAPIPWTIIKGFTTTALSVFFLEPEADSGPIIAQHAMPVGSRETSASLFSRMVSMHYTAGRRLAESLAQREIYARLQDSVLASSWPKRNPADGEITAALTCAEIDALVRALLGPYGRAFVLIAGHKYQIGAVRRVCGLSEADLAAAPAKEEKVIRFSCSDAVVDLTIWPIDSYVPGSWG